MARLARVEVFAADEIAIVHVMNRTVRRCFLLGEDLLTGKNFDHRKVWIDEQLIHQARNFGIDLLCQAILSNHFHLVLRSRPDVVAEWDDTEVARRWLMLCPERRDKDGKSEEPSEFELNSIRNDKSKVKNIRSRLSDISWWMRLLSQNIAQRANKEDGELGKFWQARYRAVRLLDETAILACAAYVDLNPIRAAMAETIEDSDFTSAQKRCCDMRARHATEQSDGRQESRVGVTGNTVAASERTRRSSRHLSPVPLVGGSSSTGPCVHKQGTRCSNKGFLPMSTADYLSLLDWTARQTRADKRGATPKQFAPLFDRLGISADIWCRLVKDFGRLFSVVAGQPSRIDEHRSQDASRRYRARRATRELLATV
ncbi:MAG: hypothetical protein O2856_07390 [Planctomycetota bacterium]|nr:hypothetical protein [Planctomycetota bacterium]